LLIACGCASAQGYLFAKPLSADELTELLQKHPDQPSIF
jgi:EAL domain-containing protein (putative c-di-GMP-specific phosphodiesterase class I)